MCGLTLRIWSSPEFTVTPGQVVSFGNESALLLLSQLEALVTLGRAVYVGSALKNAGFPPAKLNDVVARLAPAAREGHGLGVWVNTGKFSGTFHQDGNEQARIQLQIRGRRKCEPCRARDVGSLVIHAVV